MLSWARILSAGAAAVVAVACVTPAPAASIADKSRAYRSAVPPVPGQPNAAPRKLQRQTPRPTPRPQPNVRRSLPQQRGIDIRPNLYARCAYHHRMWMQTRSAYWRDRYRTCVN